MFYFSDYTGSIWKSGSDISAGGSSYFDGSKKSNIAIALWLGSGFYVLVDVSKTLKVPDSNNSGIYTANTESRYVFNFCVGA